MPQEGEARAAIEPGGILDRVRHREEGLTQQERSEGAGGKRRDQCRVAIEPAEMLQGDKVGEERYLDRYDQGADYRQHNKAAPGKLPPRQRERGKARRGE